MKKKYNLNEIEKRILKVLLENGTETTSFISKEARVSWNTGITYLRKFEKLGWVERLGAGQTGSTCYWTAITNNERVMKDEEKTTNLIKNTYKVKNKEISQFRLLIPKRFARFLKLNENSLAKMTLKKQERKIVIEIGSSNNITNETFK